MSDFWPNILYNKDLSFERLMIRMIKSDKLWYVLQQSEKM